MLGITTMKLYQEFVNAPTPETQALIDSSRELLIVGMSATGTLLSYLSLLIFLMVFSSFYSSGERARRSFQLRNALLLPEASLLGIIVHRLVSQERIRDQ